jgi:hypothetical protein
VRSGFSDRVRVAGLVGAGRVRLCYAASAGPQEMETWARERKGGGGGRKLDRFQEEARIRPKLDKA